MGSRGFRNPRLPISVLELTKNEVDESLMSLACPSLLKRNSLKPSNESKPASLFSAEVSYVSSNAATVSAVGTGNKISLSR